MGGWIALLLACAMAEPEGWVRRRPGAGRAGGRFHREADVRALPAKVARRCEDGRLAAAVGIRGRPIRSRARCSKTGASISCSAASSRRMPVRILQGVQDPDVPWNHASSWPPAPEDDVVFTLIKDGDHRLSRPRTSSG